MWRHLLQFLPNDRDREQRLLLERNKDAITAVVTLNNLTRSSRAIRRERCRVYLRSCFSQKDEKELYLGELFTGGCTRIR